MQVVDLLPRKMKERGEGNMSCEIEMKAYLTQDDKFIFVIDGFKIHDSDWGNVSYQLIQFAKDTCFSKEEKEHERKKVLKQYAIQE
jgi:hypothetical protein